MSCRTGPLRVERAFARLFRLSWGCVRRWASRCSGAVDSGHRPGRDDEVATTGIHATKWPPSAQEARPSGLGVYPIAGVRLGSSGGAGDQKDARRGAEPVDAGSGWKVVGGEVSK